MDNKLFYDDFEWEKLETSKLQYKIDKIMSLIPDDVNTIIDLGCGNGVITNELGKKFDVTGIDRSRKALSFVKTKKILSGCENINLPDDSFDMVFSSELLEHLEEDTFINTVNEIKRLSKKYIFITVPNNENINKSLIQCPNCKYLYNRSYHLRNFTVKKIINHFPGYKINRSLVFGKKIRYYNPFILNIKQKISPPISWMPYYWTARQDRKTICPKCEHKFEYKYKFNIFAFICDMFNVLISPKKPYWLFVILEKNKYY